MDAVKWSHVSGATSTRLTTPSPDSLPTVETAERSSVNGSVPTFVCDESVIHDPLDHGHPPPVEETMLTSLDDDTKSDVVHDDSDDFGGFGNDYMVDQWSSAGECDFSDDDMMVDHGVRYDNAQRGNGDLDGDTRIVDESDMGTKQPAWPC